MHVFVPVAWVMIWRSSTHSLGILATLNLVDYIPFFYEKIYF